MRFIRHSNNLKLPRTQGKKQRKKREKLETFYHVSPWENVKSIKKNGIFPGPTGKVFLCDSQQAARIFVVSAANRHKKDGGRLAIIPVRLPVHEVMKAQDKEAETSAVYGGMISKKRIAPKKYIVPVTLEKVAGHWRGKSHYFDWDTCTYEADTPRELIEE